MKTGIFNFTLIGLLTAGWGFAARPALADESIRWELLPQAQVDSAGIFLDQIILPATVVLPHLRLMQAPGLGQAASLSRKQIIELVQKHAPELFTTNWSGAAQVRVTRRTRQFLDSDLTELLTSTLQQQFVKNKGQLEVHLTQSWTPIAVPDEALTLKLADLPPSGFTGTFVATCELWNGKERIGSWRIGAQASLWRDVPVAHSTLLRGQLLRDADISMERRDILALHDAYLNFPTTDGSLEFAETVQAGNPVLNRAVRVRPTIQRGRLVEAVFQEGSLNISLKVETLEDGLVGQTVRVRNPKTKRELYGKVQNEETVLIDL
jgi:flagella basal body P-ring formation protein FlgA